MFEIAYLTRAGARENNEDRVFINGNVFDDVVGTVRSNLCLAAVCDGVGGSAFGEVAATTACEVMKEYTNTPFTENIAKQYAVCANEKIAELQRANTMYADMSTTLAAVYSDCEKTCVFNLGDSEVLRLCGNYLTRLSELHSLSGAISRAENKKIESHVITKCLDGNPQLPFVLEFETYRDEVLLIVSDGVSDVVGRHELKCALLSGKTGEEICEDIYELATQKGSKDNISVIIIRSC